MTLYTRTGDKGDTGLIGGTRVSKNNPRVMAYGSVDELNCSLGYARSLLPKTKSMSWLDESLRRLQNECFVIGANLATPSAKGNTKNIPTLPKNAITQLELEIDAWEKELPPLKNFILPGGSTPGAALHLSRAICRRAEREAVSLKSEEFIDDNLIIYLNRLSSWLFVSARWVNKELKEVEITWKGK